MAGPPPRTGARRQSWRWSVFKREYDMSKDGKGEEGDEDDAEEEDADDPYKDKN
jgi:hypothetical protein